jgi:phage gpG-like protein
MLMRLSVDVFGDVQLDRRLLRFEEHAGDLSPVFEALADDFLDLEGRQFASEGGFASGGWAPLAPSTVRRRGTAHPILTDSGDLRASLTQRDGKGSVRRISDDEMFVGTDVDYAQYHQTGTRRMPRRRPVELRNADRQRWVKAMQRFLTTGEAGMGL